MRLNRNGPRQLPIKLRLFRIDSNKFWAGLEEIDVWNNSLITEEEQDIDFGLSFDISKKSNRNFIRIC
jgi:hypothetical protein